MRTDFILITDFIPISFFLSFLEYVSGTRGLPGVHTIVPYIISIFCPLVPVYVSRNIPVRSQKRQNIIDICDERGYQPLFP